MSQLLFELPSTSRSSYIILLGFPSQIEAQIVFFKRLIERKFGYAEKVRSTPHLTMLHFVASKNSLPPIIGVIKQLLEKIKSTDLNFTRFNSFGVNKLLFLDLEENDALKRISTYLQREFKVASPEILLKKQELRPHVTIAQYTNNPNQFNHVLQFMEGFQFQKQTSVKSIVIFDQIERSEVWRYDFDDPTGN